MSFNFVSYLFFFHRQDFSRFLQSKNVLRIYLPARCFVAYRSKAAATVTSVVHRRTDVRILNTTKGCVAISLTLCYFSHFLTI